MAVSYAGFDRRRPPSPERQAAAAALVSLGDRSLAGEVGAEVATSLSAALMQLDQILQTGHAGRAALQAVRVDVERAREVAMLGQQVSRLAAGMVRAATEPLELPDILHAVMQQGRNAIAESGLELRLRLQPAGVTADVSLLFTLLQCLVHWAVEHCDGPLIELSTEVNSWPVHALLHCQFALSPPDRPSRWPPADDAPHVALDTVAWRLVEQAAAALQVQVLREESADEVRMTLAFPEAGRCWLQLVDDDHDAETAWQLPPERPLLGGHRVLLLTTHGELHRVGLAALRPLDLQVRVASPVDALRGWADAPAEALVADSELPGLSTLCEHLDAGGQGPALVLVGNDAPGVHVEFMGHRKTLRLGLASAVRDLPLALRYALTQ